MSEKTDLGDWGGRERAKQRLIFNWPRANQLDVSLPFFLVLAAGIHATAIFALGIKYPLVVGSSLRPAVAEVLGNRMQVRGSALAWLRAEDPALVATGRSPIDLLAMEVPATHTPSFDLVNLQFRRGVKKKEISASMVSSSMLRPVRVVATEALEKPPGGVSTAQRIPTSLVERIVVSGEAGDLHIDINASAEGAGKAIIEPRSSAFLVRVRQDGRVQDVFLVRSSGNSQADINRDARLRKAKASAGSSERWCYVEIFTERAASTPSGIVP
jgi:hypothetical protein